MRQLAKIRGGRQDENENSKNVSMTQNVNQKSCILQRFIGAPHTVQV
jgi:hypothetical protein